MLVNFNLLRGGKWISIGMFLSSLFSAGGMVAHLRSADALGLRKCY